MKRIEYNTHLQEVCDMLKTLVADVKVDPKDRLTASRQLIEIEHLVAHGDEASEIIKTIEKGVDKAGNKALNQIKKLEKKPWENDDDLDETGLDEEEK